jgi:uncharacterized glyoxalase superfamily protein PhnB
MCIIGQVVRPGETGSDSVCVMTDEAPIRVGLRVPDVGAATTLYRTFGFASMGSVPLPDGDVAMAILRRGPLQLLVDALEGIPFADTDRERLTKAGPRGLGVTVGLEVDDVDRAAEVARQGGCLITHDPEDAPWGERYVELEDAFGYAWKFFKVIESAGDGLRVAHDTWFGGSSRISGTLDSGAS